MQPHAQQKHHIKIFLHFPQTREDCYTEGGGLGGDSIGHAVIFGGRGGRFAGGGRGGWSIGTAGHAW